MNDEARLGVECECCTVSLDRFEQAYVSCTIASCCGSRTNVLHSIGGIVYSLSDGFVVFDNSIRDHLSITLTDVLTLLVEAYPHHVPHERIGGQSGPSAVGNNLSRVRIYQLRQVFRGLNLPVVIRAARAYGYRLEVHGE